MNPNQPLGFGSGSPMLGQGGQVAQQMQNGAPALNQMGTNAPGYVPGQQMQPQDMPNPTTGMPSIMPPAAMQAPGMPPGQPQQNQKAQIPKSEAELIIEALAGHLKNKAKIEELQHEILGQIVGMPPKGSGNGAGQ